MGSPRLAPGEFGEPWYTDRHKGLTPAQVRADTKARWSAEVRYRDGSGRLRQLFRSGATKGAATRALARAMDAKRGDMDANGQLTGASTVEALAKQWLAHKAESGEVSPNSISVYASEVRNNIIPRLGRLRLSEVTTGRLEDALNRQAREKSTGQAKTCLNQMFAYAKRRRAIASNPMRDVELRKPPKPTRPRVLTDGENLALDAAVAKAEDAKARRSGPRPTNRITDLILLSRATAARLGELLALRWRDVVLDVEVPYVELSGTLIEPRKDGAGTLHRQDHRKAHDDDELVHRVAIGEDVVEMFRARRRKTPYRRLDDPVFCNRKGRWLWQGNVRTELRRATEADPSLVDIHPHLFRATAATRVANALGLEAAQALCGHSNPNVTRRYYVREEQKTVDVRDVLRRQEG